MTLGDQLPLCVLYPTIVVHLEPCTTVHDQRNSETLNTNTNYKDPRNLVLDSAECILGNKEKVRGLREGNNEKLR